jgi:hypothetical protein
MRSALPALIALVSCTSLPQGKSGDPALPSEVTGTQDLRILAQLDPASADPVEGGIGLFHVMVRNASKRHVILRDLALPDGTAVLSWINPPPRPLEYDSRSDEYRAETGPRAAGEAVHIGLLLPGESILFRPQVRLLDLPRRYRLTYHSYSAEEVSKNVYFETAGSGTLRYRRIAIADVAALQPVAEAAATHRSVIFPYAHSPTENPLTAELALNAETPQRKFRLADALRRASIAPSDVEESTYCLYLDAWPVRTRDKSWLITPRAVTPLPRITRFELCFFHLDTIESHLPVQFEFTGSLDVRFPDRQVTPMRDPQGRTRKLAFIERSRVAEFLKEVAEKGLEVEVRAEGRSISLLLRSAPQPGTPTIAFPDALKKAAMKSTEVVEHLWSEALQAWAVRTRSRAWHLSDRGAGALPEIPWFAYFFRVLDERAAAGDLKFVIPAEEIDAFPFAPGGLVKKSDLPRFLGRAQERGLKIEVPGAKDGLFRLTR